MYRASKKNGCNILFWWQLYFTIRISCQTLASAKTKCPMHTCLV